MFNPNAKLTVAGVAVALGLSGLMSSTALAQEITLSAPGGNSVTGTLLGFDGTSYRINSTFGELSIAASQVECTGAACPVIEEPEPDAPARPVVNLPPDLEQSVVIAGSDTFGAGLMPLLSAGYANARETFEERTTSTDGSEFVSYLVTNGGFGEELGSIRARKSVTSDAFANLIGKSADLGMASRRITQDEADALARFGAGDMFSPNNEHIVAADSLVVIVHPSNKVQSLTLEQVRGIFSGEITNWSELGGNRTPIQVVEFAENSGTASVFNSRLYGDQVKGRAGDRIVANGNAEAANAVLADSNAISYVSLAFLRGNTPVTIINECGLPMTPDTFSARTEEYSLQRFLYLYSRDDTRTAMVRDFIDYATSSEADGVIQKSGFIDLGIDRRPQSLDGQRAEQLRQVSATGLERRVASDMLSQMANYDRLSATFRFTLGSSRLTRRGELNIARLTEYLEQQPAGTRVRFVGFTDSLGAFENNLALAASRAAQVQASVLSFAGDRLDGIVTDTAAYGELAPTGCNDSPTAGSRINRRVEVWIEAEADS